MPIEPSDLRHVYPRTAAALESLGCIWYAGPMDDETPDAVADAAAVLRRPETQMFSARRRAIETLAACGGATATALLVEALLRDPDGDLRRCVLEALSQLPGPAVDGAIALGLADGGMGALVAFERRLGLPTTDDRVSEEGRATQTRTRELLAFRGPAAFVVIEALWREAAGDRLVLAHEMAACAVQTPRVSMRRALPSLRWHARSPFATDQHRMTHRRTAAVIAAATAPLEGLPVTVDDAPDHGPNLPRPSEERHGH